MQFDPHATARQIIADTNLTDPTDIADAVYDRTPADAVHEAYRHILRNTAREAIRTANMQASAPLEPRRTPNRSSRVAAIKRTHVAYFDQRVFANGDWKLLRDCTREDVLDLAAQRQEIADRNAAKAAEFESIHERMVSANVNIVGDLETLEAAA